MALNINRNVDDIFYRYKMPRLVAKVEGKGNGIKTVVANMPEIAKALNRPPTYPTKYFGCELGAQTQFDAKNDRYIVNGEHDQAKLQEILDGFIKKFVLCESCENPETSLVVKKGQILQSCKACGHSRSMSLKHKLTTFILKNPPPVDEADSAAGKKGKGRAGKRDGQSPTTGGGGGTEDGEAVGLEYEGSPEIDRHGSSSGNDENDDYEPEVDASVKPELSVQMKKMLLDEDAEKSIEERLDMFDRWLDKQKKENNKQPLSAAKVIAEAERLEIREKGALLLSRHVISPLNIIEDLNKNHQLLLRFSDQNKKAQRYLLGGIEQLLAGEHKAKLLPTAPHVLKTLYDLDLVEEDVIIEWSKKPSKKFVASKKDSQAILDAAAPFVKWLEEAEEESSDDEDGDVQFGNSQPATTPTAVVNQSVQNGASKGANQHQDDDDDDEDELDIDNI